MSGPKAGDTSLVSSWRSLSECSRSYRPFLAIHNPRTVLGPPGLEKTNLGVVIISDADRLSLAAATPSRVLADG
jgi:hypothetical protein